MRAVKCNKTKCKLEKIKNQVGAGPGFSGISPFVFNYTLPLHKIKKPVVKKKKRTASGKQKQDGGALKNNYQTGGRNSKKSRKFGSVKRKTSKKQSRCKKR
jgi:hypothetical protein